MSYDGVRLACAVVVAVSVALSIVVSAHETPATPTTTPHNHPHHEANHQHHGHHKLTHHSLVGDGAEDLENEVLQRTRRSLKDKLGLLGLAGQLYNEQKEDQKQAFQKVSMLLSDSIAPEPSNTTSSTSTSTAATTTSGSSDGSSEDEGSSSGGGDASVTTETSVTQASGSSTTAAPYKATASELMGVLRKNILGLRNLFQKEWRQAMEDSEKNTAAAMVEFKDSIRPFLRRNETITKG